MARTTDPARIDRWRQIKDGDALSRAEREALEREVRSRGCQHDIGEPGDDDLLDALADRQGVAT
jgi:hypothetical protein